MNLKSIFSNTEIVTAFQALTHKRFQKRTGESRTSRLENTTRLNALGVFLKDTEVKTYYSALNKFELDPYSGIAIKKSNGKQRPLLIPSPKDRVVLAAMFPKIREKLKKDLSKRSALGLGVTKKEETAEIKRVVLDINGILKKNPTYFVLKLDFKDFFSSIDRKKLLRKLRAKFNKKDKKLFFLLKQTIQNTIIAKDTFWEEFKHLRLDERGIPQGLSYSPLLASFYALELDDAASAMQLSNFRYLDDMLVIAKSEQEAVRAYREIEKISKSLDLNLHPLSENGKTRIIAFSKNQSFTFLGIEISKNGLEIPTKAIEKFKLVIQKEIVNRSTLKNYSREKILDAYKDFADGWTNHYKSICPESFKKNVPALDAFLLDHIEKRRSDRKRFFGYYRLTVEKPFLKLI